MKMIGVCGSVEGKENKTPRCYYYLTAETVGRVCVKEKLDVPIFYSFVLGVCFLKKTSNYF